MPVDVSAAAEQAMEQMGVTEEDINAQVVAATTPGGTPPAKEKAVKEPEVEEEVVEAEPEEVEEDPEPEGEVDPEVSKTIPIQRFNKVYREMKDMERYLQAMVMEREQLLGELRGRKVAVREVEVEEPDWDTLTPAEMARQLQHSTKTLVADVVREVLQKEIAPVKADLSMDKARQDMHATAKQYKDYWNYQDAMITIATAHPELNAKQVYLLAKGDSPLAQKAVVQKLNERIKQKKNALTERHSSPTSASSPVKTYKNVKDIARAVAEKMGLDR